MFLQANPHYYDYMHYMNLRPYNFKRLSKICERDECEECYAPDFCTACEMCQACAQEYGQIHEYNSKLDKNAGTINIVHGDGQAVRLDEKGTYEIAWNDDKLGGILQLFSSFSFVGKYPFRVERGNWSFKEKGYNSQYHLDAKYQNATERYVFEIDPLGNCDENSNIYYQKITGMTRKEMIDSGLVQECYVHHSRLFVASKCDFGKISADIAKLVGAKYIRAKIPNFFFTKYHEMFGVYDPCGNLLTFSIFEKWGNMHVCKYHHEIECQKIKGLMCQEIHEKCIYSKLLAIPNVFRKYFTKYIPEIWCQVDKKDVVTDFNLAEIDPLNCEIFLLRNLDSEPFSTSEDLEDSYG